MRPGDRWAVVVVNYASSALIAANLRPLESAASACLVVVVDNFSTHTERAAVRGLCADRGWTFVPRAVNDGFGAGVNHGVAEAIRHGAGVFVLLNPDAVADADVLAALVDDVREDPRRVVSPRIQDSSGRVVFAGAQVHTGTGAIRRGWVETETWRNWLTGACMAYSAEVHLALGGFDEDYFLYWEDVDFSRRAAQAGFELRLRPDLMVIHDEGGTQPGRSRRTKSNVYYYYNARNRLRFARRHHADQRWAFARSTPRESHRIWLRGGRAQLVTRPTSLLAIGRGSIAGLWWLARRRPGAGPPSGADEPPRKVAVALPSSDLYGSDRVALESVAALTRTVRDVVAIVPRDGPLVAELRRLGADVVQCPAPVLRKSILRPRGLATFIAQSLVSLPRAHRTLRSQGVDLLYANTVTNVIWLAAGRLAGVRVVCHVHEAEASYPAVARKALYAPLFLAHRIIANSHFTLGILRDAWPVLARRSSVVLNPVPGPAPAAAPPRPTLDRVTMLFIGRLSPRKGPHVAIEALRLLVERGYPAHLELLGTVFEGYEWFESDLRAQARSSGLADRVTFLGFDAEVWGHAARADVVLVPSTLEESFGNTAVEAMLAARPLVVSATSGLLEATAGYRWVQAVRPSDPEAIADAVADIVRQWPDIVETIVADRDRAVLRHCPDRFHHDVLTRLGLGIPSTGGVPR